LRLHRHRLRASIKDIADFLCRSEPEVRKKIAELGWSQT
jgi:hypothetical protein